MPREKIGYDPEDPLSILGRTFRCPRLRQYKPFLSCPACEHFPCDFLDEQDMQVLFSSPFLHKTITGLKYTRRQYMEYIGKTKEGELEFLHDDFDPANPDLELVTRYDEIYPISKVYVPQVKLVTRTKPERERIKQDMEQEKAAGQEAEEGTKKASKSSANSGQSRARQKGLLEEVPEPEEKSGSSSVNSRGKKSGGKDKGKQGAAEG
ncbi:MAG: hypothetical protein ACOCZ2_00640 [Thermodesulfobacteriota bacterium]